MIRIIFLMLTLACSAMPATAQTASDPYAQGREVIADIGRIVTPKGIQETFTVDLGGARQVVNVRGSDRTNPIILFIHGGPGAVEMPIAWSFQRPWEDFFTVVQWDQRGAGRSYLLNNPATIAPTMTFERYRDDAIQLIELLRTKYQHRKVFVLGHSWGSTVGLAVAAKRPDLLHAYVGMGQIINFRQNERAGLAWTLTEARRRGDTVAEQEVKALQPYPDRGPFTIDKADGWRKHGIRYGALAAYRQDANFYLRSTRLSPEYDAADRKAWVDGAVFTVKTLFPRLRNLSFTELRRLDVPVVMLLGRHDYVTPSSITNEWMGGLSAPAKQVIWFEHSAHLPMVEEPGRVLKALLDEVKPFSAERH